MQHLSTNVVKPACSKQDSQQAKTHVNQLMFHDVSGRWWHVLYIGCKLFSGSSPRIGEEGNRWVCDSRFCRAWQESPGQKGAATRRRLGEQVEVNMHTMGTSFIGKVRDVRQIAEAQIGERVANIVEFKAQVSRHKATNKASRIQVWQGLSDWQHANRFEMG